jgi:hypothetical protein
MDPLSHVGSQPPAGSSRTPQFYLGLDLGQRHDHTALAVLARDAVPVAFDYARWSPVTEARHTLFHLERFPLGLPYVEIAETVASRARSLCAGRPAILAVDATGLGGPVVEMIRRARPPAAILEITITGSAQAHSTPRGLSIPRRDLLTAVAAAAEHRDFAIAPNLPFFSDLRNELAALRPDASSSGKHDDLAIALSLALYIARLPRPRPRPVPRFC